MKKQKRIMCNAVTYRHKKSMYNTRLVYNVCYKKRDRVKGPHNFLGGSDFFKLKRKKYKKAQYVDLLSWFV